MTPNNTSKSSDSTSITSEDIVATDANQEQDSGDGYADTQTDIDPRTSNTGVTSEGGSDSNADAAGTFAEEAVPGVRRKEGEALYE